MEFELRGYVLPWGAHAELEDGVLYRFVRGAFDNLIAKGERTAVRLQAGGHEEDAPFLASTASGHVRLFDDGWGLGFEAAVTATPLAHRVVRKIVSGECSLISGSFVPRTFGFRQLPSGARERVVVRSGLAHVAIVPNAAFRGTGIWLADAYSYPSRRVADLAAIQEREARRPGWETRVTAINNTVLRRAARR